MMILRLLISNYVTYLLTLIVLYIVYIVLFVLAFPFNLITGLLKESLEVVSLEKIKDHLKYKRYLEIKQKWRLR